MFPLHLIYQYVHIKIWVGVWGPGTRLHSAAGVSYQWILQCMYDAPLVCHSCMDSYEYTYTLYMYVPLHEICRIFW